MNTKPLKAVEKTSKVNSLAEISQNNRTEFCLAKWDAKTNKIIQCHQFVHCRDFMGDAVVAMEDGAPRSIWGFSYNPKTDPALDMRNASLLLRMPDAGALKNFQANFPILKDIEDALGWDSTFPELVKFPGDEQPCVFVLGSQEWLKSAPAFAAYSYILKCLTYPIKDSAKWMEEIKVAGTTDSKWMIPDYMKWFVTHLNEINEKYTTFSGFRNQKSVGTHTIHDHTGFYSMHNLIWTGAARRMSIYDSHVLQDFDAKKA